MAGGNKRSYILKQICCQKLHVSLSMYNLFLPPPCMEGLKLNVLHITSVLYIAVLIIDCFKLIPFNKNIGTFEIFQKSSSWLSKNVFRIFQLKYRNVLVSLSGHSCNILCKIFCREHVFGLYFQLEIHTCSPLVLSLYLQYFLMNDVRYKMI